jgi:hypothetical protein
MQREKDLFKDLEKLLATDIDYRGVTELLTGIA